MSTFEDKLAEILRLHEAGEKNEGSKSNRLITKILTANASNLDEANKKIKEFISEDNVPVDFAYENKQGVTSFIAAALKNNVPIMRMALRNGGFDKTLFEKEYIEQETPQEKIKNNKEREKYKSLLKELNNKGLTDAANFLKGQGVDVQYEFQERGKSLKNTSSGGKRYKTKRRGKKCGKKRKTCKRSRRRRRV